MDKLEIHEALSELVASKGWEILLDHFYEEQNLRLKKLTMGQKTHQEYEALAGEFRGVDRVLDWPVEQLKRGDK